MTSVVGRLRPGVSRVQAQSDLARIASQLSIEKKFAIQVSVEPSNQPPSWLRVALASLIAFFMVGVFVVLLIACDDIAILLVARIAARQREIGVRLALGASRAQLVRQLVAENLLLALLGGAGAVTFSLLSARVIERLPFQSPIPDSSRLTLDWRVFLFATALSLATTLLFGLRPALQHAWNDVVVALNPGATQSSARYSRIRSNLVMTQVTVSTALLITAGLLVGSTRMNLYTDHGFRGDHVLIGSINFTGSGYDADKQRLFYERLLHRLAEERQIISACIVDSLPIALPAGDYFRFGGFLGRYVVRRDFSDEETQVFTNVVSPGQFDTLRIQLIEGRDFNEADRPNSPKVGIVNSAMARRLWSNESAVGRTVRGEDGALIEIVGVAADIRYQETSESRLCCTVPWPSTVRCGAICQIRCSSGRPTNLYVWPKPWRGPSPRSIQPCWRTTCTRWRIGLRERCYRCACLLTSLGYRACLRCSWASSVRTARLLWSSRSGAARSASGSRWAHIPHAQFG
jgi:predicted permease